MKYIFPILSALLLSACVNRDADIKGYFEKHKSAFDSLATQLPGLYADSVFSEVTITPGDIENPALQKTVSGLDVVNISFSESRCDKIANYDKVYFLMKNTIAAYYIYSLCPRDTTERNVQPLTGNWYYVKNRK